MKPHKCSPSSPKLSAAIATPIIVVLLLALVSLYDMAFSNSYPHIDRVASSISPSSASPASVASACDFTRGEWVMDTEAPYYTNLTCPFIDDHQNCMKFGKPSLEFMRWRWQPDGCDLPRFDAASFLEAMRGKSMAFVGDSLARNHLKSLLCILSQVRTGVHHRLPLGDENTDVRASWHADPAHLLVPLHGLLLLASSAADGTGVRMCCRRRSRWRSSQRRRPT